ncbi:cyclin-dependent protein kinase inhibitor SMR3-like [Actinidia eriantha]|uniref:cyclin-dependent protein kinase inhibitor SMR3-like n=1 Tax=Actinidia eriantha TaxID=165200 RepID=UPI0025881D7B|nr:cyclin-dependent protein kinase inhibitor SMR3-like [Actinidia eriantha]
MFTEFHQIPFLGMSNPEFPNAKENKKQIELEIPSRPTSNSPNESQITPSDDSNLDHRHQDEEDLGVSKVSEDDKQIELKISKFPNGSQMNEPELHDHHQEEQNLGESNLDEDEDGFRTPTSSDHKIPAAKQCPPAPKKLRPRRRARRKVSPVIRRRLQIDLSKAVESTFPPRIHEGFGRKIKSVRTDDTE